MGKLWEVNLVTILPLTKFLKNIICNHHGYSYSWQNLQKKSVIFHLPDCVIEYSTKDDRYVYTPKPNCQNIYPRTVSRRVVTWSNSERSSQCLPTMLARYSHPNSATSDVWTTVNNDDITGDVVRWMLERGITYKNFTEDDHLALRMHWNNF